MQTSLKLALVTGTSIGLYLYLSGRDTVPMLQVTIEPEIEEETENLDENEVDKRIIPPKKPVAAKPKGDRNLNKLKKPRNMKMVLRETGKLELLTDREKCEEFGKKLTTLLKERKFLDEKRYLCISRAQYRFSCGVSSLTGVWNYLFSVIGNGDLPPITQEEALAILGFDKPYGDIRFGPFTGNTTILGWFNELVKYFGVRGHSSYFWKVHAPSQTFGMTKQKAKKLLKEGLKDKNVAFIYHCHNHYMTPIGFEDSPLNAEYAYADVPADEIQEEEAKLINESVMDNDAAEDADVANTMGVRTWILVGDSSKTNKSIHCIKFDDIAKDLSLESPNYLNIRHLEYGVMQRKTQSSGNINCIMAFYKDRDTIKQGASKKLRS